MKHPHAELFIAIANGESLDDFQCLAPEWDLWENASSWLAAIARNSSKWQVRRKQKMRRIGEHTFPAPMTEAPANGVTYFIANFGDSVKATWFNDDFDKKYLAKGIAHSSKEAAEAHSKALAAIVRGEPI